MVRELHGVIVLGSPGRLAFTRVCTIIINVFDTESWAIFFQNRSLL